MMAKTKDEIMRSAMEEQRKISADKENRLRAVIEGVYNSAYKRGRDDCILEELPIQAPDTAVGKWEPRILPGNYKAKGCTVCRAIFGDYGKWNYCPNCGAKMKGADNDV